MVRRRKKYHHHITSQKTAASVSKEDMIKLIKSEIAKHEKAIAKLEDELFKLTGTKRRGGKSNDEVKETKSNEKT